MALSNGGNQDNLFQSALAAAAKSPIGVWLIVVVAVAQTYDTIITVFSSKEEGFKYILPMFCIMVGAILIILLFFVINNARIGRQQVQQSELQTRIAVSEEEKRNYRRVIWQKNKEIKELKEQLENSLKEVHKNVKI